MDSIDVKIVECLKENARENASVIGSKVNMSVSAVIERIKKLEAAGVIKQYTLVLDNEKLGLNVCAYLAVETENSKYNASFEDYMKRHPYVTACDYVASDFEYLVKIYAQDLKTLEKMLNDIKALGGVGRVKTLTVLSNVKDSYSTDIIL